MYPAAHNVERAENLKLFPLRYHTDTLVTFSEVAPVYADKLACAPVSFTVQQGERSSFLPPCVPRSPCPLLIRRIAHQTYWLLLYPTTQKYVWQTAAIV